MNKNARKPLSQRLCETFDIPVGTFGKISFIEAAGNRELSISGCESLVAYTEECVVLELCDGCITIRGSDLTLRSFTGGRVTVNGIIVSIFYGREEAGGDAD
ncbi:MAG: YabP/YqfC family sporulation protein [Clostridia bacterium]|nr:YabP/YqfC family sporulation protein [Clostridia bacterium]